MSLHSRPYPMNDIISEEDSDFSSTSIISESPMTPPPIPPPNPNATQSNGVEDSSPDDSILMVGLSDPILSNIRRKKLDIINRLHSLGIQHDIDIPTIVVIGSQSAGKSSLIESISGINLPRSAGTCTRCPTECRLIRVPSSEEWECAVSLRFLTDQDGSLLDAARNVQFGDIIKNPRDVEERLRRAQLAILNPSVPFEFFLEGHGQFTKPSLNFSNNIVCLEIKGPDVTDLSFCDLPGLIASVADGGRDEDVEEVRELVASYIRKESCIILLTVTCEVDFETQGAYRLARKYDPKGKRTIGVLTKPDRIPEGKLDHARWLRLIRNESSPLVNGWYCVKQLSSVQLQQGYTFEESRRICERFFKETHPWKTLEASSQRRLGTKAVTIKLNEFLMDVIDQRIPEIIEEIEELLQKTKTEIGALPPAPSADPFFEIMHLINQFCDTLYSHCKGFYVPGDDDNGNFVLGNQFEGIREAQNKFREAIRDTAPVFQPYDRAEEDYISRSPTPIGALPIISTEKIMYLNEISAMASRAVTRELPGFYPFHVVQDLITRSTEQWKIPAMILISDMFKVVCDHQAQVISGYFAKYTSGGLCHIIRKSVNEYMQARKEKLEDQIKWLLQLESTAFTLNESLFLSYKVDSLEQHNNTLRNRSYPRIEEKNSALTIITTVEAYFQVSHKRFVDNVPLAVDHGLVRIEKRAIQEALCTGLKLSGPDAFERCAKFLAESTEISDLRKELKKRLKRLTAAQEELLLDM
ncbi:hypothetical protein Clacol_002122 [Clathrus columnatus]|uniref:P-loop containing nucleoside triphosphate hydrolase protein n=1 Tax=Clathrus columnatus TaxID=1419009 RepID=A0AAV5A4F5_9AGAM|nr:hypothetical protein Clacol_002122 [Clathrus columnatus]